MTTLLDDFAPRQVSSREVDPDIEFSAAQSLHENEACRITYVCTEDSIYCCESC